MTTYYDGMMTRFEEDCAPMHVHALFEPFVGPDKLYEDRIFSELAANGLVNGRDNHVKVVGVSIINENVVTTHFI
jgi:hypothetical protein